MFEALIVGSGPTGAAAAYGLRGRDVLVLDVGNRAPAPSSLKGNLYELRRTERDLFEELIGPHFEGLHNLHRRTISLKLKAPLMQYIVQDWERLCPLFSPNFEPVLSFAKGGLANGWGAGVYRFSSAELDGYPIAPCELDPFYDELTAHIGISGCADDLSTFFGSAQGLQNPLRISRFYQRLLDRYSVRRPWFLEHGVHIGRPRLAVLTEPLNGRRAYEYENLEFFRPYNPAVYNPAFTVDELTQAGQIRYESGYLVTGYREVAGAVEVFATNLKTNLQEVFRARNLILAAGALSTAKIVLASNRDYNTRLPILDNPMSCVPLFVPRFIGSELDTSDTAFGQLNLIYREPGTGEIYQGTFYGTTGPLRSDVLFEFPLSISANVAWAKALAPAMGLLMLFYPGRKDSANYLKLRPSGELEVNYGAPPRGAIERALLRLLRKAGYYGLPSLCQYPPMGSSLHYSGSLPMSSDPGRYQTGADGRLAGTERVYIADGACLPSLPAKNLTFTTMANSLRIATRLRGELA